MKKKFYTLTVILTIIVAAFIIHGPPIVKNIKTYETQKEDARPYITEGEHYIFVFGGTRQSEINDQMLKSLPALMNAAGTPIFIASYDESLIKTAIQSNIPNEIIYAKRTQKSEKEDLADNIKEQTKGRPKLIVFESGKNLDNAGEISKDNSSPKIDPQDLFLKGNSIIAGISASSPYILLRKVELYFRTSDSLKRKPTAKIYIYWNGVDYTPKTS